MNILNIEIKASCNNPEIIEEILLKNNAKYIGEDHQIDTYFNTEKGRLKLREGKIENSLILYNRIEIKGLKKSEVILYKPNENIKSLKQILENTLKVWVIVDKTRKIFFIENVKFHIDKVKYLGSFIEIEAIDNSGNIGEEKLRKQCNKYIDLLKVDSSNFIDKSYSDLISLK
jgi:predicted adenylyl cyclase CyaB